jgi:uncharacterized protein
VTDISTPCIRICILNPETGLCEGCGRTLEELARWLHMSEPERQRVMADLPRRLGDAAKAPEERL